MSITVNSVSSVAHPDRQIKVELSDRPLPARMRLEAARTSLRIPRPHIAGLRHLLVALQSLRLRVMSR